MPAMAPRCHLALALLLSALLRHAGGSPALVTSITAKVQTCLFNKLMGAYARWVGRRVLPHCALVGAASGRLPLHSCKANDAAGMPIGIRQDVPAVLSSCLLVADSTPQVWPADLEAVQYHTGRRQ